MNAPFPITDTHRETVRQMRLDAIAGGMTSAEAFEAVAHLEIKSGGSGLGMVARTAEELRHLIEEAKQKIEEAALVSFYAPPGFDRKGPDPIPERPFELEPTTVAAPLAVEAAE